MTDQPTPETDAIFTDNVPEDAQIVAFCERLERERDAARAERDELNRQLSVALKGKRPYSSEFADDTIAAQVKRIAELEEKLNGWFSERDALRADVARLRTALEAMLIAEMELRQMDGFSADEAETEPHWMAARAALATPAQ
jgi:phage shock protein A